MRLINKAIIPLIIAVVTLCSSNIQWGGDKWKDIIEADGKGYYAYLPALFIYHDLNFGFFDSIESKYPDPGHFYDYRSNANGKTINKYYVGTALAISPFFFVAHTIAGVKDGYTKAYPVMVNIAAIFYLFLGLYYLKRLLKHYSLNDSLISFVLVALVFGTNVFYYTVAEPAMSHIYSFAFMTMFLFYMKVFFISYRKRELFLMALLLGIIFLIRPVNLLVVLAAPFLAGNKQALQNVLIFIRRNVLSYLMAFVLFFLVVFFQAAVYRVSTGQWWVYSYGDETFNWLHPHLIDFLISYKKGLFLYTPLILLSLYGLVGLFRANRFMFWSFCLFALIVLYVLSSWWNWWYGGSFSSRVVLEYYAIFAILMLTAFDDLKKKWARGIYSALVVFCILLCQLQTFQYRYYLIHWEKMDREHYWRVFMRMDGIGKENPNKDLLD